MKTSSDVHDGDGGVRIINPQGWLIGVNPNGPPGSYLIDCSDCKRRRPIGVYLQVEEGIGVPLCLACGTNFMFNTWPCLSVTEETIKGEKVPVGVCTYHEEKPSKMMSIHNRIKKYL